MRVKKFLKELFSSENIAAVCTTTNLTIFLAVLIPYIIWRIWRKSLPPGPFGFPYIGNFHLLIQGKSLNTALMNLGKKYGHVFRFGLGGSNLTVVMGHELIREALIKSGDIYRHRPNWMYAFAKIYNKKGIVWSPTDTWHTLKQASEYASSHFVKSRSIMEATIQEEIRLILNEFFLEKSRPVNIHTIISNSVYNLMSTLAFGERLEFDRPSGKTFKQCLQTIVNTNAVQVPENYHFYLRILPSRRLDIAVSSIEKVKEFLEPRLTNHKSAYIKQEIRDFMDVCLTQHKEKNNALSDDEILHAVIDLFLSGCEPTISTILWAFLFMIKYPEIQKQCRHELLQVVKPDKNVTWKDKSDLPFITATLNEVQRIANTVPVSEPYVLLEGTELGGYRIPKNDIVLFHFYASHMDPTYWKRPQEFRPENFLDHDGKLIFHDSFFPYGLGPRSCPFNNIADRMIFLTFANALMQYELKAPDDNPIPKAEATDGPIRFPKSFYLCPYPIE